MPINIRTPKPTSSSCVSNGNSMASTSTAFREDFVTHRRSVPDALDVSNLISQAPTRSHLRLEVPALSGRSALPPPDRRTRLRHSADRQQPPGRRSAGATSTESHSTTSRSIRPTAGRRSTATPLAGEPGIDLVVLARYMQVLSPEFVDALSRGSSTFIIRFLPAFIGARPYHPAFAPRRQADRRHQPLRDRRLDDGPIIEQDVVRISHREQVEDLVRKTPRSRAGSPFPSSRLASRPPHLLLRKQDRDLLTNHTNI